MMPDHNGHHNDASTPHEPLRGGRFSGVAAKVKHGFTSWKERWVHHTVEAPLNDRIANNLPDWAYTRTGRVLVGIASLSVIVGWAVVLLVVMA